MANSTLKIPGRTGNSNPGAKLVKTTTKKVKKSSQYKTAKKAADNASTRTKAAVFLVIGAATAAGAYLFSRNGETQQDAEQTA